MSNADQYNLCREPWIPVRQGNAGRRVSLRDIFLEAPAIDGLDDSQPMAYIALSRLVFAIARDALQGPCDPRSWADLIQTTQRGRFPAGDVIGYLDQHENAFNLFDSDQPFLQDVSLCHEPATLPGYLLLEESGVNAWWRQERTTSLDPAEAAVQLVIHQQFALGGLLKGEVAPNAKGKLGSVSGGAGPLTGRVWMGAQAATLAETIVWNLRDIPASSNDKPAWRAERRMSGEVSVTGPLQVSTWLSRRVLLRRGPSGDVEGVTIFSGWKVPVRKGNEKQSARARDLFSSDIVWKTGTEKTLSLGKSRLLWRDSEGIYAHHDQIGTLGAVRSLLAGYEALESLLTTSNLQLAAGGVASVNKVIYGATLGIYPLTTALVANGSATAASLLKTATTGFDAVTTAVKRGVGGVWRPGSPTPETQPSSGAEVRYWSSLTQAFHDALSEGAPNSASWHGTIIDAGWETVISELVRKVPANHYLAAVAHARKEFDRRLQRKGVTP